MPLIMPKACLWVSQKGILILIYALRGIIVKQKTRHNPIEPVRNKKETMGRSYGNP